MSLCVKLPAVGVACCGAPTLADGGCGVSSRHQVPVTPLVGRMSLCVACSRVAHRRYASARAQVVHRAAEACCGTAAGRRGGPSRRWRRGRRADPETSAVARLRACARARMRASAQRFPFFVRPALTRIIGWVFLGYVDARDFYGPGGASRAVNSVARSGGNASVLCFFRRARVPCVAKWWRSVHLGHAHGAGDARAVVPRIRPAVCRLLTARGQFTSGGLCAPPTVKSHSSFSSHSIRRPHRVEKPNRPLAHLGFLGFGTRRHTGSSAAEERGSVEGPIWKHHTCEATSDSSSWQEGLRRTEFGPRYGASRWMRHLRSSPAVERQNSGRGKTRDAGCQLGGAILRRPRILSPAAVPTPPGSF